MAGFSIWLGLQRSAGEGQAMGLSDGQGTDQCQGQGFAVYLENNVG